MSRLGGSAALALTPERLREVLDYDPETGVFRWKIVPRGKRKAGDVAGGYNQLGYLVIGIDREIYRAQRLVWLYVYGHWPTKPLDHINRDKTDNRLSNLREVTPSQNSWNSSLFRNNTSGVKGVYKVGKKWRVLIQSNGRRKSLGTYDTVERACAIYRKAENDRSLGQ
jgi:hypothetical protein